MYRDAKKKRWPAILAGLLAAVLLAAVCLGAFEGSGRKLGEEGAAAMKAAIARSALQCYAVEGGYPATLAYLQENYGLRVNTNDYYVTYDCFASNLPPDIRVTAKR